MSRNRTEEHRAELLDRFLDGDLTSEERDEVKVWIDKDPGLRVMYQQRQKMRALIREVYEQEMRSADLSGILPAVHQRIAAEPRGFWYPLVRWLDGYRIGLASRWAPVAVGATVVVAAVAGVLVAVSSKSGPAGSAFPVAVHETKVGGPEGSEAGTADEAVRLGADLRRPPHGERGFRVNEAYIEHYSADSGIVVIDVDPDGDLPTVVWHLPENGALRDGEGNSI
jgi:anti-sigma factor RsiW